MPQNNSNEVPFFHHLFMEHAFLFRATGFILALKSCLFDRFFRRIFAIESKKKSLCWRVLWAKKNVCRLLTPINEKVKKKWLYLSFWRRHVVILVNVLWRKVVVFLLTSLCFLCFCCWKDDTSCFLFFFRFFSSQTLKWMFKRKMFERCNTFLRQEMQTTTKMYFSFKNVRGANAYPRMDTFQCPIIMSLGFELPPSITEN